MPAYMRADQLYTNGEYADAAYFYTKAYNNDSLKNDLVEKIADSYRLVGDHLNAGIWYQLAIAKPDQPAPLVWMNYAKSLMITQNYEEARVYLEKCAQYDSEDMTAQRLIASLNNLNQLFVDSNSVEIKKISLNTSFTEFSPSYYNEGIIFLSNRYNTNANNAIGWSNEKYIRSYFSTEKEDGSMSEPSGVFEKLNAKHNYGSLCFYNEGHSVMFSRSELSYKNKGKPNLQMYHASYDSIKEKWCSIKPFKFNLKNYSFGHATINKEGTLLVFSSNMPGGFGGADLYISEMVNDDWSTPQNLGGVINSVEDELYPYFQSSGELIFSSKGHGGLGDLDLYETDLSDSIGLAVNNLGYPFSSSYADFGYISDNSGTMGYFCSNRAKGGLDDDIYNFVVNWCKLSINVSEQSSHFDLKGVKLEMIVADEIKDVKYTSTKGNLAFITFVDKSVTLKASKKGYYSSDTVIESNQFSSGEQLFIDLSLTKIHVATRDTELKTNYAELQKQYNKQKTMILIDGNVFEYREVGAYRYLVNADEKILLAKETVDLNEPIEDRARKAIKSKGLTMDESFVINNLYFDKDAITLSEKAKVELNKVSRIMTIDTQVAFEITSFTDSQGSASYNNELAFKRSQTIARYLMLSDISGSRLILESYGEQGLTNNCDDNRTCDDLYHALNRRAELKLVLRKIYN